VLTSGVRTWYECLDIGLMKISHDGSCPKKSVKIVREKERMWRDLEKTLKLSGDTESGCFPMDLGYVETSKSANMGSDPQRTKSRAISEREESKSEY